MKYNRIDTPPALDAAIRAWHASPNPIPRKVLCLEHGVSYDVLRRRTRELGLAPPTGAPKHPWSAIEEDYLRGHPEQSAGQIRYALHRLTGIHRTIFSIRQHRYRIAAHYERLDPDTWSARQLAGLMGVSDETVGRWIKAGQLRSRRSAKGNVRGLDHIITRNDLRAFLIEYPSRWDHRRVNQLWLIELLAGRVGPKPEIRRAA